MILNQKLFKSDTMPIQKQKFLSSLMEMEIRDSVLQLS